MNGLCRYHRRYGLSDFHEMVTHLRIQEERSLLLENHACRVNPNRRRYGFGRRQFSYSEYLTEKKVGIDLSLFSEGKTGSSY